MATVVFYTLQKYEYLGPLVLPDGRAKGMCGDEQTASLGQVWIKSGADWPTNETVPGSVPFGDNLMEFVSQS